MEFVSLAINYYFEKMDLNVVKTKKKKTEIRIEKTAF